MQFGDIVMSKSFSEKKFTKDNEHTITSNYKAKNGKVLVFAFIGEFERQEVTVQMIQETMKTFGASEFGEVHGRLV